MAMIDVYGISESGKRVKVGQVDEGQVLPGYSVTFPSSLGGEFTFLSINDGDAAACSTYAGQTITGVEYLTITTMSSGYGIYSANITGNNSFYQEHDDGEITRSGTTNSLVLSGAYYKYTASRHILIVPSQNIVFSSFTAAASK